MKDNEIMGYILAGGVVLVGFAIYKKHSKMAQLATKMEKTLNEMADKIELGDTSSLVKDAVDRVVSSKVSSVISKAVCDTENSIRNDIAKQVQGAIDLSYNDIRTSVEQELSKRIGQLNIESVRREVIDKAKETAAEKFKEDLDIVLAKYNSELENISQIYSSIAKTMNPAANVVGLRTF